MTTRPASARYSGPAQFFHWFSALLVVLAWTLGQLWDTFPKGPPRQTVAFTHETAGEVILVLLALRLIWRLVAPVAEEGPSPFGRWADIASRGAHAALYALLFATCVAGIVMVFAGGRELPFFGLGEIHSPWPRDKEFRHAVKEIHELYANSLIVLATLHAAAALTHHFYLRDAVLRRMLPSFR